MCTINEFVEYSQIVKIVFMLLNFKSVLCFELVVNIFVLKTIKDFRFSWVSLSKFKTWKATVGLQSTKTYSSLGPVGRNKDCLLFRAHQVKIQLMTFLSSPRSWGVANFVGNC
jgi:hypothetical protein